MAARELTRDEKKKIRRLVTGMCANYDGESGLCLPLDCPCYMLHKCWTGAYCRYFRNAVLPLDPALEITLTDEGMAPELRPEKPGAHEENAGEKAGRLLRFACREGLIFRAF